MVEVGTDDAISAVVAILADGEIVGTHPLRQRVTREQLLTQRFQDLFNKRPGIGGDPEVNRAERHPVGLA